MKILFVYPEIGKASVGFQQGIGSLSATLKAGGHQTSLICLTEHIEKPALMKEIIKHSPELIAFSSTTPQYHYVEKYSSWIKEELEVPIICGGVHATMNPDRVLSSKGIDVVCVGEGEYPLLELANRIEEGKRIDNIENLWIKNHNAIIKNPVRALITNLNELQFPDREIFDFENLLKKMNYEAEFMAGRGCPYECSYCCNHGLKGVYRGKGTYARIRSVDNVLAEIKSVVSKYHVERIVFHDDTFTLFHDWIDEFTRKYPTEFDLPFRCNARVETLNRQILSKLKKAGCDMLLIGIESGNEWLRRSILNRHMTNQQITNAFRMAHEIGLKTWSFNMVGIPYETSEMAEETIELNRLIQTDIIQVSIFYPYPNTALWELCSKNGYISKNHVDSYFEDESSLNLPTMSKEQTTQLYRKFCDLAFERRLKTNYPLLFKFLQPFLRPKTTNTLRQVAESIEASPFRNLVHGTI